MLKQCTELKVVIDCMVTAEWFKTATWPTAIWQQVMPVFRGGGIDVWSLGWCKSWVLEHPDWQLTSQFHRAVWGVR